MGPTHRCNTAEDRAPCQLPFSRGWARVAVHCAADRLMGRKVLIGVMILGLLLGCKPGRDQGSGLIPPADTPANPLEPANAPASAPASAPNPAPDFAAVALDASGTEPFWSLVVRRDSIALTRPGHTEILAVNPGPRMEHEAVVWETTSAADGGALKLTLQPRPCSNGMSDRRFPYAARVDFGGEILSGCAAPVR